MAVGDILETRFITFAVNQLGINVRHYKISTEVAPAATQQQIADQLSLIFGPLYIALLSTSAQYRGMGVKRINPLPITNETLSGQGAANGSVAGDPLPRSVSGIITLRTAFAGRKFRGRVYIPFPGESDNTATQVLSAGYFTALQAIAGGFLQARTITNGAGSTGLLPVLWHRRTRTSDELTQATSRPIWATQRRRGDYGRPNLTAPI